MTKTLILAAAGALALSSTAFAQTPATPATPAKPAATTPAPLSSDTPIEQLMANDKAREIVMKDMGGDPSKHPMYDQFKSMSLKQVAPMSGGAITDDMLKKLDADLAGLGK